MLNGRKLVAFCGKASCFVRGKCFAEDVSLGFGEDLGCSLRETMRAMAPRGWIAATPDQYPLEDFDAFVFQDMPKRNDSVLTFARQHARPCYLVVVENPLIDKLNAEYGRYREFTRVFTFEDEAVRKFHCTKLNYVFDFSKALVNTPSFEDRRFAVMISSRVKKLRPGLVSYKRVQTIWMMRLTAFYQRLQIFFLHFNSVKRAKIFDRHLKVKRFLTQCRAGQ